MSARRTLAMCGTALFLVLCLQWTQSQAAVLPQRRVARQEFGDKDAFPGDGVEHPATGDEFDTIVEDVYNSPYAGAAAQGGVEDVYMHQHGAAHTSDSSSNSQSSGDGSDSSSQSNSEDRSSSGDDSDSSSLSNSEDRSSSDDGEVAAMRVSIVDGLPR